MPHGRSNRSTNNTRLHDGLERQIQAELQHRRLNQAVNAKRLGNDFLNDLKLPQVDNGSRPGDMSSVKSRGQQVIDRQRENIEKIQSQELNEQKRLLSRHKTRDNNLDKLGRGSNHYRSNAYLASEENASKQGYSMDSRMTKEYPH